MHGAGVCGALELDAGFGVDVVRDVNLHGESLDHARGCCGHLFINGGGGAVDVDAKGAGLNAEDGEDACAEGGGDEVGGGEAFAFALVVLGRVGGELGARGAVYGATVEVALIFELDGYHVDSLAERVGKPRDQGTEGQRGRGKID